MHHLLNEFRPHQARETLRVMMEMQKRQRVETTTRFQKHLERVKDIVNGAFASLPEIHNDEFDNGEKVKMEIDTQDSNTNNRSDQLDRIMCKIVDGMD